MSSLHESGLIVRGEKKQRTDKRELRPSFLVSKKAEHRLHLLRLRPIQYCTMAIQCHVVARYPLVRCSHPRNQARVRLWAPAKQVSFHLSILVDTYLTEILPFSISSANLTTATKHCRGCLESIRRKQTTGFCGLRSQPCHAPGRKQRGCGPADHKSSSC